MDHEMALKGMKRGDPEAIWPDRWEAQEWSIERARIRGKVFFVEVMIEFGCCYPKARELLLELCDEGCLGCLDQYEEAIMYHSSEDSQANAGISA
jgi:hypothetical protein